MAQVRGRTEWYYGPKDDVGPERLSAFDDGQHVIEEKHDGQWALVTVRGGRIVACESRVGLPSGASLVGMQVLSDSDGCRVVGELVADLIDGRRTGTRRLHLFDIVEVNDETGEPIDLRSNTLAERRAILEVVAGLMNTFAPDHVFLVEQRAKGFVRFYKRVLARGGEGVVMKSSASLYRHGKTAEWIRCKPRTTGDFVVMAQGTAEKGTPNLTLGLYVDGVLTDVMRTGIPSSMRTKPQPGDVVEVEGQERFPSGAIRFGEIRRIRDDKAPSECVLEGH